MYHEGVKPAQVSVYDDLLAVLSPNRRAHSRAVGSKAARLADLVPASVRDDLIAASTLHDIGYGHPVTGFHALDGAAFLASRGFSAVVCNLVLHHSASTYEAEVRGIDSSVFRKFDVDVDLGRAHAVLWWSDLTTGPTGQEVTVEDRLNEICKRYGPSDVVTRFIEYAKEPLLSAGHWPIGSIQVSA